jgi:hypothetical protein
MLTVEFCHPVICADTAVYRRLVQFLRVTNWTSHVQDNGEDESDMHDCPRKEASED